jgi:hypothetical protein
VVIRVLAGAVSRSRRRGRVERGSRRLWLELAGRGVARFRRGLLLEDLRRLVRRRAGDRTNAWIAEWISCRFLLPSKSIVRRGSARLPACLVGAGRGPGLELRVERPGEILQIRLAGGRVAAGRILV